MASSHRVAAPSAGESAQLEQKRGRALTKVESITCSDVNRSQPKTKYTTDQNRKFATSGAMLLEWKFNWLFLVKPEGMLNDGKGTEHKYL